LVCEKLRPDFRTTVTTDAADEAGLYIGQADIIRPLIGAQRCRVGAAGIAALDEHIADAGFAHLAEGGLLRGGRHGQRRLVVTLPTFASARIIDGRRVPLVDSRMITLPRAWCLSLNFLGGCFAGSVQRHHQYEPSHVSFALQLI
jgi:hypothetical protein